MVTTLIANKLKKLMETKAKIKKAIERKNVPVPDITSFESYSSKILNIEEGDIFSPYYQLYKGILRGSYRNCPSLFRGSKRTSIDLSCWDTKNIKYMTSMFSGCTELTTLDLSNFNTCNVTTMPGMFAGCTSLKTLDLSNFNTSKVWEMTSMFDGCTSLEILDISNFDMSLIKNSPEPYVNSTYADFMFLDCTSLHTLRLDNCSNDTINKIISSKRFPINEIDGVIRKIYCKKENISGLTAPTNWTFIYV